MISLYKETNSIPETYAVAVVGATIGEAGICGWIRTRKMRVQEHKWEEQDKKASKKSPQMGLLAKKGERT